MSRKSSLSRFIEAQARDQAEFEWEDTIVQAVGLNAQIGWARAMAVHPIPNSAVLPDFLLEIMLEAQVKRTTENRTPPLQRRSVTRFLLRPPSSLNIERVLNALRS